jgi:hypothetical protein
MTQLTGILSAANLNHRGTGMSSAARHGRRPAVSGLIDFDWHLTDYKPLAVARSINVRLKGADSMGPVRSAALHMEGPLLEASIKWRQHDQVHWKTSLDGFGALAVHITLNTDQAHYLTWLTPDAYVEQLEMINSGLGPLDAAPPCHRRLAGCAWKQLGHGNAHPAGSRGQQVHPMSVVASDWEVSE